MQKYTLWKNIGLLVNFFPVTKSDIRNRMVESFFPPNFFFFFFFLALAGGLIRGLYIFILYIIITKFQIFRIPGIFQTKKLFTGLSWNPFPRNNLRTFVAIIYHILPESQDLFHNIFSTLFSNIYRNIPTDILQIIL